MRGNVERDGMKDGLEEGVRGLLGEFGEIWGFPATFGNEFALIVKDMKSRAIFEFEICKVERVLLNIDRDHGSCLVLHSPLPFLSSLPDNFCISLPSWLPLRK